MPSWTDVVSAIANLATTSVALYVAVNWRKAPARQRRDECISAIHMCASLVGRTVSFQQGNLGNERKWRAHDESRDAWRSFRQAYAVARTYKPSMSDAVIEEGVDILDRLTALCSGEHDEGTVVNVRFGQLVARVDEELKAIS